jgi:hypothetical protein
MVWFAGLPLHNIRITLECAFTLDRIEKRRIIEYVIKTLFYEANMQKVYIVIMAWLDEDSDYSSSVFAVFTSREKAKEYIAIQKCKAINKGADFRIEPWEVQ